VNRLSTSVKSGGGAYRIGKLQAEVTELQTQLKISEETRGSLVELVEKMKDDKVLL